MRLTYCQQQPLRCQTLRHLRGFFFLEGGQSHNWYHSGHYNNNRKVYKTYSYCNGGSAGAGLAQLRLQGDGFLTTALARRSLAPLGPQGGGFGRIIVTIQFLNA